MLTRPGRFRRSSRLSAATGLCIAVFGLLNVGLGSQDAQAASSVSGCFSYAGTLYENVPTGLFYASAGKWVPWRYGTTGSDGCVTYRINKRNKSLLTKIFAAATVTEWRGVFFGGSPYVGPRGRRAWSLGTGEMTFAYLPPEIPAESAWGVNSNAWIEEMGTGANCEGSSALAVACWMDANGMHGNVVVLPQDWDNDGFYDNEDHYPTESAYH